MRETVTHKDFWKGYVSLLFIDRGQETTKISELEKSLSVIRDEQRFCDYCKDSKI